MKEISTKQFNSIHTSGGWGKTPRTKWAKLFIGLKKGKGIFITKTEWTLKCTPTVYLGNYRKRRSQNWAVKSTQSGYYILRTK